MARTRKLPLEVFPARGGRQAPSTSKMADGPGRMNVIMHASDEYVRIHGRRWVRMRTCSRAEGL